MSASTETAARRRVARIREAECIGCTRCIKVCPTHAIIGAPKLMHVVFNSLCTGCDLCLEPCPVDCIDMVELLLPPLAEPAEQQSVVNASAGFNHRGWYGCNRYY